MVLLLSTAVVAFGSFGAGATGLGTNETLYFNLSKNSSWYTNGSGDLYARFYKGSTLVGNVKCTMQSTNIYKATSPAVAADTVQLAVYNSTTEKDLVLNDAKTNRVYLLNTKNWSKPYLYNWKDGSKNDGAWPGKDPGMTALSGKMYYYEITKGSSYKYVIFSNNGHDQTDDLEVFDDMKYWDGANSKWVKIFSSDGANSKWVKIFSSSTSKLSLSSKASDANEIYLEGTNLRLSKYQYSGHDNFAEKTFYVYNPNWTSTAYVQYDLSDPYQRYVQMTKVANKPAGFYKVTLKIAPDAAIKFSATNSGVGASLQTTFPDDTNLNCYKMGSGAEMWVKLEDAQKVTADYFADKNTSGDDSGKAFWVDATYYDYLSDSELSGGGSWLRPKKTAGTWFSDSEHLTDDNWYPFYQFNDYISSKTSGVTYPLYFGNFCNTDGSYPYNYLRNGGYGKAVEDLKNFHYIADNSNGLPSYNYSVQGLAASKLSNDGDITFPNGTKMPYFQQKTATDGYAKSVQSYFPFRSSTTGTGLNRVTRYTFTSKNAKDNVFFKWSNGKPTSVAYGRESGYGVHDGLADFNYDDYKNNQHRGYGIFPFNNKGNGNSNPGNGAIDYGFGVKMDMNFRVPANGTLNGQPDGEAVKFTFSGDDDLWVYISPVNSDGSVDYANSKLVLDLGGSHKEASGNINFKTMKSTVDKGATIKSSSYSTTAMYIKDTSGWGKVSLWAWSDSTGGEWFDGVSSGSTNEYKFEASQKGSQGHKFGEMKYFFVNKGQSWDNVVTNTFKDGSGNYEEWPGYTKIEDGKDRTPFLVQSHFGRRTYIDHPSYMEKLDTHWRNDNGQTSTDFSIPSASKAGDTHLDPTKMYHMTVFYMERGLIESNCKIEFTMTPAQNDYQVEKIVDTTNVNSGVASKVQTKDKFAFTTDGTYGGASVSRNDAKLGNNELKDYDNKFDTGTNLKTSEGTAYVGNTGTVSKTEYSTKWIVADTDTGQIVKDVNNSNAQGTGKSTSSFNLKRQDNSNDSIHLKSTFTNTPVTAPLNVVKKIYEKNEEDQTVESKKIANFKFKMEVDLNGGTNYQAYPLDYTAAGHAGKMDENGYFTFSSDETVTVPNLPKNATFRITESKAAGYTARQSVITGTVGSNSTVTFNNVVTPSTDNITGIKKLNGVNYTGDMFRFKLEGFDSMGIAPTYSEWTKSSVSTKMTLDNVTNGEIKFNLSFTEAGTYRYKFYEDTSKLEEYDNQHGTSYAKDIKVENGEFYVEVKVTAESDELTVESIKYFKPVYFQNMVDIDETFMGTPLDSAEFDNTVTPASVSVYKTDSAQERVDGVWFYLFKVSGDGASLDDAEYVNALQTKEQDAKVYDQNGQPVMDESTGKQKVEKQHGVVIFDNIDIYKDSSCSTLTEDPYQWYCLAEGYDPSKGLNVSQKKVYFKFPTNDKYDFAVTDWVNGILKNPQTSGNGMDIFKTVGIGIIGLAALSFGGYMIYIRTPKRRAKRIRK